MNSMNDLGQRRAVIFQILKEIMSHEDCMQALWILENNYAQLNVVPILEYVDRLEQEVTNVGDNKLYVSRELTKILYIPIAGEYCDPWKEMQNFRMYATDSRNHSNR